MSADVLYSQIRYVSVISEIAESRGIQIRVGSDFEEFQEALEEQREAPPLYPMFDPACSYVDRTNGFWITGVNDRGELVHTQAIRRLDLSDCTLAEHFELHHRKYVVRGPAIDHQGSTYGSAPGWRTIMGSVCYHGQLWLKGGKDGYRDQGLTAILPRLALALSLMEWSPDYVFGFISPHLACRGLAAREGYAHMEPGLLRVPTGPEADHAWLVWLSRADIEHLMQFTPEDLFRKLTTRYPTAEVAVSERWQAGVVHS